jgi:Ca2+/Na+ antiporter
MALMSVWVSEKHLLPKQDWYFVILFGATILFGFAASFNTPPWVNILMLTFAALCYLSAARLTQLDRRSRIASFDSEILLPLQHTDTTEEKTEFKDVRAMNLRETLLVISIPFPILYLLRASHSIDNNSLYLGLIVANFLAKVIFLFR